ncbi:asparagine synthase (glutamine-hydrolyzing) [uncultured Prochlorococcus sp.]|uniref:asparagine synthase (glutamine-hydrolyzing) n=1 Tax=uncultured Prochlorococcus sp. TaxID=159733 RepID=UPI00258F0DF9|nr:asparagine synthase (glutamine-hydrolyzing) [uncultured Prochlorococcus sp.]
MCGIYGHYFFKNNQRFIEKNNIEKLDYRGPDSTGIFNIGSLCLAHKRLAILDLSKNGSQPYIYKNLTIIFNGEIYNHKKIRNKLLSYSYDFEGRSDTEVLIKAFHKWGSSIIKDLIGMFAFVIYDSETNKLIMARDRAGEKPIYYFLDDEKLVFASEIKALQIDKRDFDYDSISYYFSYGYFPRTNTPYSKIKKLLPGSYAEISLQKKEINLFKYWEPISYSQKFKVSRSKNSKYYHLSNIDKLLKYSIQNQLQADVKVAVLLSGGIDSGLITAIASHYKPDIEAFTVKFEDSLFDESEDAKLVAKHLDVKHTIFTVSAPKFKKFKEIVSKVDEPFADSSIIPTYFLCKNVSKDYKVALSGDGGDELFGGYNYYKWCRKQILLRRIFPKTFLNLVSKFASSKLISGQRGFNFFNALSGDIKNAYACANRLLTPSQISNLFDEKVIYDYEYALDFKKNLFDKFRGSDLLKTIMKADFLTYLPDDILIKTDRSSMFSSLELRTPFLDKEIIKYAYEKIPSNLSVKNGRTKILLRMLAKNYLPNSILNQKKRGFEIPLENWMKNFWYKEIRDYFFYSNSNILDHNFLKKIFIRWEIDGSQSNIIYSILCFLIWEENNKYF